MSTCYRCRMNSSNDVVCSCCGMFVNNEVAETASKEETLEVLKNIRRVYIDKLVSCEQRKTELDRIVRNTPSHLPKYTRMKFFWPFFIIAFVVEIIVAIIAFSAGVEPGLGLNLLLIFSFVITIIVGFSIAGKRQENANAPIYQREMDEFSKRHKAEKERTEVENEIKNIKYRLDDLRDLIPIKYLTKSSLNLIIENVKLDKARTISESVDLLNARK